MSDVHVNEKGTIRECQVVVRDIMQEEPHNLKLVKKKKKLLRKKTSKLKSNLNSHSLVPDKESPHFTCDICDKSFSNKFNLYRHKETHSDKKPFECPVCKKSFRVRNVLQLHQEIHNNNRTPNFHCNECGKAFLRSSSLYRHKMTHVDPTPYKCAFCNQKFKFNNKRRQHELTHSSTNKSFSCKTCHKEYSTYLLMRKHSLSHLKKPFACKQCPMTFTLLIFLERHKLSHDEGDDNGFVCKICHKVFVQKRYLVRHQQTCNEVAGKEQNSFECDICGKKYPKKSTLRKHTSTVHNVVIPFDCHVCGKILSCNTSLRAHILRLHNDRTVKYGDLLSIQSRSNMQSNTQKTLLATIKSKDSVINLSNPSPFIVRKLLVRDNTSTGQPSTYFVIANLNDSGGLINQSNSRATTKLSADSILSNSVVPNPTASVPMISKILPKSTIPSSIKLDTISTVCSYKISDSITSKSTASEFIQLKSIAGSSSASSFLTSHADFVTSSKADCIHSNSTVDISQPKTLKVIYRCLLCSKSYDNKQILQKHLKEHTSIKKLITPSTTYHCERCCIAFENQFLLDDHNSQFHDRISNSYGCVICKTIFSSMEKLFEHGQQKHQAKYLAVAPPPPVLF